MRLTGAEIIIRVLQEEGIGIVSGIPGGANLPLYDALSRSGIRHILARHEQGAGFIAHGVARSTGKTAVCFATSGPGVMNLLTAVADAKLDSVPLVAVTGQVPTFMIGTDAFQEVDTYGMTLNITKHNYLLKDASRLTHVLREAFMIAGTGRKGPVVVDVPKDVQMAVAEFDPPSLPDRTPPIVTATPGDKEDIHECARLIRSSHRPVIYGGGGIIHGGASEALRRLARRNSIPVALTLMGLGAFPPDDPLYLGLLGMHGAPYTNVVLDEADLVLALGVRFDDRAAGKVAEFCPRATIVHVDIDQAEINKLKQSHLPVVCDVGDFLERLLPQIPPRGRKAWRRRMALLKARHPSHDPSPEGPFHPTNIIRFLAGLAGPETLVCTDVGQHQMWVAQTYPFRRPRTFLTSGGLGTMGFGLPAAIGAALANPERKVLCFTGDGSIQMNIQELATLADLNLDVTVVVMNNQHLGLVRQQQELFYGMNYVASRYGRRLDFAAIGREFGIEGCNLSIVDRPFEAIKEGFDSPGPRIIDIPVPAQANVFPMVPPGAPNRRMITGLPAMGGDCRSLT